jgi:hypothetical protein
VNQPVVIAAARLAACRLRSAVVAPDEDPERHLRRRRLGDGDRRLGLASARLRLRPCAAAHRRRGPRRRMERPARLPPAAPPRASATPGGRPLPRDARALGPARRPHFLWFYQAQALGRVRVRVAVLVPRRARGRRPVAAADRRPRARGRSRSCSNGSPTASSNAIAAIPPARPHLPEPGCGASRATRTTSSNGCRGAASPCRGPRRRRLRRSYNRW